jgi:hypothetical protein
MNQIINAYLNLRSSSYLFYDYDLTYCTQKQKNVFLTWCVKSGQHRRLHQLYLTRVQQRGHWGQGEPASLSEFYG